MSKCYVRMFMLYSLYATDEEDANGNTAITYVLYPYVFYTKRVKAGRYAVT